MTLPLSSSDPTFRIYLALAQYPILQRRMRAQMRNALFEHDVIEPKEFEALVRQQAISTQASEGQAHPFGEEPPELWHARLEHVRNYLTDLHFANNLPIELFEKIIRDTLAEQGAALDELALFNPELAPVELLFEQATAITSMPPQERKKYEARLQEIKVVLIRTLISDQLAYVDIAKQWLTIDDLLSIRKRKIGAGKIGGKAAGMLLAYRILNETADADIIDSLYIPDSYFIGADVMYAYMATNDLMKWADQKYKPEDEIRGEFPTIQEEYARGEFPIDILERLQGLLYRVGDQPLIVRSSSLLEDNFGTSFAGKYESCFCPNQGSAEQNLHDLTQAIAAVYASGLNPDALLYRRSKGLQDYDERIAVLVQVVQGGHLDRYYLPHAAGVAFSRNLFRWSPEIRRQDGFVRLVWGLGTRAVERVGSDYPRLVALSHPRLYSHADPKSISKYSQRAVDLIDLEDNQFKTLSVSEVLPQRSPILRYLVQSYQDGYLSPLRSNLIGRDVDHLVLTFDELLNRTPFADRLRRILAVLEEYYRCPVDMEFTARLRGPNTPNPEVDIFLLQCRPQSHLQESRGQLPADLNEDDVIFSTNGVLPQGWVDDIRYVLFVSPEGYYALPTPSARAKLSRAIGRLNAALADEVFICIGPGRWGTANPELGVGIGYSDIYHSRALVELSGEGLGLAPEPSFGTHFFQDLIESHIYPLAIYLDDKDVIFRRDFFYDTPNRLAEFLPEDADLADCLRLIDVTDYHPDSRIHLVMDDDAGKAVAFLEPLEIEETEEEDA